MSETCIQVSDMNLYPNDPAVRFVTVINDYSLRNAGKWLLSIPKERAHKVWDTLVLARFEFPVLMMGNDRIVKLHNGNNIICVWARGCDYESVHEMMIRIRDLGILDDMRFKTDVETEGRHLPAGYGSDAHIWKAVGNTITPV